MSHWPARSSADPSQPRHVAHPPQVARSGALALSLRLSWIILFRRRSGLSTRHAVDLSDLPATALYAFLDLNDLIRDSTRRLAMHCSSSFFARRLAKTKDGSIRRVVPIVEVNGYPIARPWDTKCDTIKHPRSTRARPIAKCKKLEPLATEPSSRSVEKRLRRQQQKSGAAP